MTSRRWGEMALAQDPDGSASAPEDANPTAAAVGAVAAVGLVLALTAGALTAGNLSGPGTTLAAIARASTVGLPIAVGLYAWRRRPEERFGRLLVLLGVGWFVTVLAQSSDSLAFSTARVFAWVMELGLAYLMLAFPTGHLRTRADRLLMGLLVALVATLYLPSVPLSEYYPEPSTWTNCEPSCPANAFFVLDSQPAFVESLLEPVRALLTALGFFAVAARLVSRMANASDLMRRTLLPVLAVAIARLVVYATGIVTRVVSPDSPAVDAIAWLAALGVPALAAAFFVGLIERQLYIARALQTLGLRSRADNTPSQLQAALADALADPSLELVRPMGGDGDRAWTDAEGRVVDPPRAGAGRGVIEIRDGDRLVAVVVHDAALADQREFLDAVAAYALIALENRRLTAEVEASLRAVRDSRARIVASADRERRAIERDLHDGAQQRLVALGIQLKLVEQSMASDPEVRCRLQELHGDVATTLEEIRALAHGVYPPLLADRGLAEAVRAAARTMALPVTVEPAGIGRYPQEVESAVYFCCLEALQNVSKHADGATAVTILLAQDGDELRFEVRDDGCGFETAGPSGVGMTNMCDRVEAIDGHVEVRSTPSVGTVVTGRMPVSPAEPRGRVRQRPAAGIEAPRPWRS